MKNTTCRVPDGGAVAVEYALAVAFVSLLVVAAAVVLGDLAVSYAEEVASSLGDLLT